MTTQKNLEDRVREMPLTSRLAACLKMISTMCSERRPPKMSIPVQWDDEDFFISVTLVDAIEDIKDCRDNYDGNHA